MSLRTAAVRLGVAACSLGVALLMAEAALRLIGFQNPRLFVPDSVLGQWHRPNAEGWQSQEGRAYITINADGLRDREHTKAKPPNVFRIAVLGDSVPEAFQLPMEKSFWAILEQRLSGCAVVSGKKVEAINFGIGDFGTAQEALTLEQRALAYDPDLVLVAFAANDVRNNSAAIEWQRMRPFFVFRGGQLTLDDSFASTSHQTMRNSPLWQWTLAASDHVRLLQTVMFVRQRLSARTAVARLAVDESIDDNAFRVPPTDEWREAWRVTEALLLRMRDDARAHKAGFLLVTVTDGRQVSPDPEQRQRLMEHLGVPDLFYPEHRLSELASRERFDIVTLAEKMQQYAVANHRYLHGYPAEPPGKGHWNEAGHALAADLIAGRLCAAQ